MERWVHFIVDGLWAHETWGHGLISIACVSIYRIRTELYLEEQEEMERQKEKVRGKRGEKGGEGGRGGSGEGGEGKRGGGGVCAIAFTFPHDLQFSNKAVK